MAINEVGISISGIKEFIDLIRGIGEPSPEENLNQFMSLIGQREAGAGLASAESGRQLGPTQEAVDLVASQPQPDAARHRALLEAIMANPALPGKLPKGAFETMLTASEGLMGMEAGAAPSPELQRVQEFESRTKQTLTPRQLGEALKVLPGASLEMVNGLVWDKNAGTFTIPGGLGQPAGAQQPLIDTVILAGERSLGQFAPDGKPLTSPKGAVGIAQLMPQTAMETGATSGLGWDPTRFENDPDYNRSLGDAYLQQMLHRYGGNEMLAIAAYNAGPSAVDEWLTTLGDPRTGAISPQKWASSIPFAETREYVSRVMKAREQGNPLGQVDTTVDFKVVGSTLVKTSTLHGTAEPVMDLRAPDELARKIAYNIANGASATQAVDLALGNIQLDQNPVTGTTVLSNRRTGTSAPITPSDAAQVSSLINPPEVELQASPAPSGQGGLGSMPLETFANDAAGLTAGVSAGVGAVVGQIPGVPLIAPKTVAARENIRLFAQISKQAFVNNPRFPIAEQQLIQKVLPDTGLLDPPAEAVQRVGQLRDTLAAIRVNAVRQMQDPNFPAQKREDLLGKIADIDAVLFLMGPRPEGGGASPGASADNPVGPVSPEDAAALPSGTWFRTSDGRVLQRK